MKERADDYDLYEEWEKTRPVRPKLTRFRDESSRHVRSKQANAKRKRPLTHVAKNTLLDQPDASTLNLIRESNFPSGLLSNQSISLLESVFRTSVRLAELTKEDLVRWLNGEEAFNQRNVIKKTRGTLFEEVITREFVKRNPNYFATNPVLTSKIIGPIMGRQKPGEFVTPDHLVFLRDTRVFTLVGFIEDKKTIRFNADTELFEQLEKEWSLFSLIADNDETQSQFKHEVQKNIPTIFRPIRAVPMHEGTIWLATAKGADHNLGQLPRWMTLFDSSVSEEMIDQLSEGLITKRFLPKLSSSLVKSADGG